MKEFIYIYERDVKKKSEIWRAVRKQPEVKERFGHSLGQNRI